MKDYLSPLEQAIKFEVDGKEYFLRAAEKIVHPFGKRMFEALAYDEHKHIQKIRKIKENLVSNDAWPDEIPSSIDKESLVTVFETAKKKIDKDVLASDTDFDVLKQALEIETQGHEFYCNLAEKSDDPKAKVFYEKLAVEERGHYHMLQNTEEYLKSPADWFAGEEKPIFEG